MGRFGLNSFSQAKARPSIGEELASDQTRSDLSFHLSQGQYHATVDDHVRRCGWPRVAVVGLPMQGCEGKVHEVSAGRRRTRSALSNRQRCLREMRHAGSEAGVRPLPTLGSPISDKQLWQCARQQLSQHGDHTLVAAAERMAELEEAGDREGYATWTGIALRIAKLGPQVDAGDPRH
ncbi:MAG: hypothetical protein H7243_07470 [Sphingomonadaceae bacterium]|nr:hypothetical protein [Sphingomonadaceae bacterium]